MQAKNLRGVNVHILEVWLVNLVPDFVLGDLFLKHFELFLVFLDGHMQAVNKYVLVHHRGQMRALKS